MGITYISPHCNPLLTLLLVKVQKMDLKWKKNAFLIPFHIRFMSCTTFVKVRRPIKGTSHTKVFIDLKKVDVESVTSIRL